MEDSLREEAKQILIDTVGIKSQQLDRLFNSAARRIAAYCLPHHLKWITEIPTTISTTDSQDYVAIPAGIDSVSSLWKQYKQIPIVSPKEFAEKAVLYTGITGAYPEVAMVKQRRIYLEPTPVGAGDLTVLGSINPTYLDDASPISGVLDSMPDYYDGAIKLAILAEHYTNDPTRFNQHEAGFERAMVRNIQASKARGEEIRPIMPRWMQLDMGAMAPGQTGYVTPDSGNINLP